MKRNILAATAAAILFAATLPSLAQSVSGQVNLTGFVAPRCGTSVGASEFSGTINVGELAQSNGTLSTVLSGSTENSPVGLADFLMGCSGNGSIVTLSATRLENPVVGLPGFSNDIDFTVQAKIALAAGGFATVNYTTATSLPSPTISTISASFAVVAGNFQVRVFGFAAENRPASILSAGDYQSTITVLLSPAP